MSETLTIPFATPSNYTYDNTKVEITGGKGKLKLTDNPGQDFIEPFDSDVGFTYDNTKAEFSGGQVQQKNFRPSGATFGASYNNDVNGDWGDGVLTGTPIGGATITGNRLDLTGGTLKYVDYNADLNADSQQVGAIKFKWTPNYSGAPASTNSIIVLTKAAGDNDNNIRIYHTSTLLFWSITDSAGGGIVSNAETFNPVAGTTYEVELNYDITTGATRMFINGNQLGTTHAGTGTRDSNIGLLRIGTSRNASGNADFYLDDLIIFNAVQHTANYTPGYSVSEYEYVASEVILPEMFYTGAGTLVSFDSFVTVEGGTPRYTIQVGRSGDYLYWNGSAWAVSDGTYAQSNDETTFNANVSSLSMSGEVYGQFKILFTDSAVQASVATLTASLTAQIYSILNPTIQYDTAFDNEGIDSFIQTATITGSDQIKYTLTKNGVEYYHDGTGWVASDGTYTQANTAAEIETNKSTFTAIGTTTLVKAFLHSESGTSTPQLDQVVITYNFYAGAPTAPNKCIVYGYTYDEDGNPLSGVSIYASLENKKDIYNGEILICDDQQTTLSDANGYWELNLIVSALLLNSHYVFTFFYGNHGTTYIRTVPDESNKNFAELIK